jgi:hypothetical protein
LFASVLGKFKGCKVDLDLGKVVIWMINTSSKSLEVVMKIYKVHVEAQDTRWNHARHEDNEESN